MKYCVNCYYYRKASLLQRFFTGAWHLCSYHRPIDQVTSMVIPQLFSCYAERSSKSITDCGFEARNYDARV